MVLIDSPAQLATIIDHTLLAPDATEADVVHAAAVARRHEVAALCISPPFVARAVAELCGCDVAVCTVIGFPSGAHRTAIKVAEAEAALADGARELDMVVARGALAAGRLDVVEADVAAVVAATDGKGLVKVILETAALTPEQIDDACAACERAGAHFVKTSTGFGPGGASVEAVARMRAAVGSRLGVKASGGIRDKTTAWAMVSAGATRIGASATEQILATLPREDSP